MANAEIIAIGSELLTPKRVDTNSLFITEQLNLLGIELAAKQVIGDELGRLTTAIRESMERVDIVILCGGLGPTEDDLTRQAVATALGRQLIHSAEQEEILRRRFAQFRRQMADNNLRQTYLVDGAEALANSNGTAPGQFIRTGKGAVVLLPGPPRELKPILAEQVVPRLQSIVPKQFIRVRSYRIVGMGESDLDALISPIYAKYTNPATTVLSAVGDLFVNLVARCDTEEQANALLKEVGDPIQELLGDRVYTDDTDETLEMVVGRLLRERKLTIATAESCTGGLLATRLSEHAGSSDFFLGGVVSYTEGAKTKLLGVSDELLAQETAVSEPVARAMAEGVRRSMGADMGIAVTGFAGPTGGTDRDPIGTIYFGLSTHEGSEVIRRQFGADRLRNRLIAAQTALDLARRWLLARPA